MLSLWDNKGVIIGFGLIIFLVVCKNYCFRSCMLFFTFIFIFYLQASRTTSFTAVLIFFLLTKAVPSLPNLWLEYLPSFVWFYLITHPGNESTGIFCQCFYLIFTQSADTTCLNTDLIILQFNSNNPKSIETDDSWLKCWLLIIYKH